MWWKTIFGLVFLLLVVGMLVLYWFPFTSIEFSSRIGHSNFTINGSENMQFYPNMRYPDKSISYRIKDSCTLQKQDSMEQAFDILQNKTVLNFYSVARDEEITISCYSGEIAEGGLFIAGEGGPTEIINATKFNVISHGKILLIREQKCENPNVGLHELLHALGFEHSLNPENIMYNISKCRQTLGDDIPALINKLYAFPNNPDLAFEDASAIINGKFSDINMTIKNIGLKKSEKAEIKINADEKEIRKLELEPLNVGEGKIIMLSNMFISQINVNEISLIIDTNSEELEKENNKIILKIKK